MGAPGTSMLDLRPGSRLRPPGKIKPRPVGNAPEHLSRVHPTIGVYIETAARSGEYEPSDVFEVRSIKLGCDGSATTATIFAGLDAADLTEPGQIGDRHFAHLIGMLDPDRRVRIAQSFGELEPVLYFQGYPAVPTVSWTPEDQQVSCLCTSEADELLSHDLGAQIYERRMRRNPLAAWNPRDPDDCSVPAMLPVFNAGGRPNRSPNSYRFRFEGTDYRLHLFLEDDAPEAAYWSYADALRYIVYMYVMRAGLNVSVTDFMHDTAELSPSPHSYDPFVRYTTQRVDDIGVASTSVNEALHLLTQVAGLHYELDTRNAGAGLEIVAEHRLRVWAPVSTLRDIYGTGDRFMGAPRGWDIPREAPFKHATRSDLAGALETRATQAALSHDRRAINAPMILGGRRWYEVTLLLRPGWEPHPGHRLDDLLTPEDQQAAADWWELQFAPWQSEEGRSVYHGKHPDHYSVNDVGRLWIFPDHWRYMVREGEELYSPYARINWPAELYSPFDPDDPDLSVYYNAAIGGGIAEAADWVPRRRPFGNTIARNVAGGSREPQVWFNFTDTDPHAALVNRDNWQVFGGQPEFDSRRAALYIRADDLWADQGLLRDAAEDPQACQPDGNMIKAFIYGRFMAAVTCTVCGDGRMAYQASPSGASFSRRRYELSDAGMNRFRDDRRRSGNSFNNDQETDPDPAFEDRYDATALGELGERMGQTMVGDVVSGPVKIPWVDPTYRLGDYFTGVDGLGLRFTGFPAIVSVEYTYHPEAGHHTALHLADLRDEPELENE